MGRAARRLEAAVAAILTVAAVWLNYVAAVSGGALWRDEANTVGLARFSQHSSLAIPCSLPTARRC